MTGTDNGFRRKHQHFFTNGTGQLIGIAGFQIRTVENAISWCLDRAKLSRPITDEDRTIIRNHFTSITEDGMIRDTVHTTVATLFWEMQ